MASAPARASAMVAPTEAAALNAGKTGSEGSESVLALATDVASLCTTWACKGCTTACAPAACPLIATATGASRSARGCTTRAGLVMGCVASGSASACKRTLPSESLACSPGCVTSARLTHSKRCSFALADALASFLVSTTPPTLAAFCANHHNDKATAT